MKRLLLAAALAGSVFAVTPASAINCPPGTTPATLPNGTGYCKPVVHCDPMACEPAVRCPYDVPVWSGVCRMIFGG